MDTKQKSSLSPWTIRTDPRNLKNQSELEVNTCKWRQARKDARGKSTIGVCFSFNWSRKWRES